MFWLQLSWNNPNLDSNVRGHYGWMIYIGFLYVLAVLNFPTFESLENGLVIAFYMKKIPTSNL